MSEINSTTILDQQENVENDYETEDDYTDENENQNESESELFQYSKECVNIEKNVYQIFKLLLNYVDKGKSDFLTFMTLKDVFKLIYPDYDAPF